MPPASSCPLGVAVFSPVDGFQSLMVQSGPAEARALPSGLKVTQETDLVCPLSVVRSFGSCAHTGCIDTIEMQQTVTHRGMQSVRVMFGFMADLVGFGK